MIMSVSFLRAKIADDDDFSKLKEMASVHDNWNLEYDKNGIKIWSKAVQDASVKLFKVWSVFSAVNSTDLYNVILDHSYRKEWDPHLLLSFEIGHLNYNNGLSYYAGLSILINDKNEKSYGRNLIANPYYVFNATTFCHTVLAVMNKKTLKRLKRFILVSCPPPLRSRDFVLQTSWLDKGTEHFILNHSVFHKDHPPKRGFIRAVSYFTGYFIKCLPCNGCEMFFVSQTDPQGIIPAWIVNKCTQIFAPRFVKQLERAAFGYKGWKSQNNPDFYPWSNPEQLKTPKISIFDCFPSEEEQQSSFFKYMAAKKGRSSEFGLCQSQSSFCSRITCNSTATSISNNSNGEHIKASISYSQSHTKSEKVGKEKKSKDTFFLPD